MPDPSRPAFNAYALPLPRRREGPAAALSFVAHLTIAILVLWRGAALFEGGGGSGPRGGGGGGGGGRPAVSWFALPATSAAQAHDIPQAPAVTVPTIAVPATEPIPALARVAMRVIFSPPRRGGRFFRRRAHRVKPGADATRSGSGLPPKVESPASR